MKRGLYQKMLLFSMACVLAVMTSMSAVSSQVEAATQPSGSHALTLSVKKNVAYLHGTVQLPAGTPLLVWILSNGEQIDWLTTVGDHGAVSTQNDVSWFPDGQYNISAKVYQVSSQPNWYDQSRLVLMTNSVSTVIRHHDIGFDVRRYYKSGTPTYAIGDFVYIDHWNDQISNFYWYDVMPGQDDFAFENHSPYPWFVTDGVDEYHLQYTSSTTATVQTKLLVRHGFAVQVSDGYTATAPYVVYCTFKLSKVNGAWLINNIKDIENTLLATAIRTN